MWLPKMLGSLTSALAGRVAPTAAKRAKRAFLGFMVTFRFNRAFEEAGREE
jgi:FPC/CPF motif-containing protein YcgG